MVDKAPDILQALRSSCPGADAYYRYPDFNKNPDKSKVSCYELANLPSRFSDDRESLSRLTYRVDVWAVLAQECNVLSSAIVDAMTALGFVREACYDTSDAYNKYRKTLQFTGIFGGDN